MIKIAVSINNKEDFKEIVKKSEETSIFKDKNVFTISYIPKEIYYRANEINTIMNKLGNIHNIKENIDIWGAISTGKTLSIKYILKTLEAAWAELGLKMRGIYIPCERIYTNSAVLREILIQLGQEIAGRLEMSIYLKEIEHLLESLNGLLIVFDDVDNIIKREYGNIIWSLLGFDKISMIFISNKRNWSDKLDKRIQSRLQTTYFSFPSYKRDEIYGILKQRIILGVKENVLPEDFFNKIIDRLFYNVSDLRDMMKFLKLLLEKIERNKEISLDDEILKIGVRDLEIEKIQTDINNLRLKSQFLLYLISKQFVNNKVNQLSTKSLYEYWNLLTKNSKKFEPIPRRTFNMYLKELKLYDFISYTTFSLGRKKGVQTIIEPQVDMNVVFNYLDNIYKSVKGE